MKYSLGTAAASPQLHSPSVMELEVPWNPEQVYMDLQAACQILSERGWKLAAKWAAEQLLGLGISSSSTFSSSGSCSFPDLKFSPNDNPCAYYARTLMDLGEYANAAAILSCPPPLASTSSLASMPPPLDDLTPTAFTLRAYALYMAGQAVVEQHQQQQSETGGTAKTTTPPTSSASISRKKNPYLAQLQRELAQAHDEERLDALGLHVYGMVLKTKTAGIRAATTRAKTNLRSSTTTVTPQAVLMQSILEFPYNWSAWLDLAELAADSASSSSSTTDDNTTTNTVEAEICQVLQPTLGDHFMFHLFCAHLHAQHHQAHEQALAIYERWLDPALLGASPYVATQVAVVQYHLRLLAPAKALLEDLHTAMPYRLDAMDVYSNILYVQEDSVGLGQLAHRAVAVDPYRPETCVIVGNYYSLKQQRAKAIQYFRKALLLDPSFTSAWTLMGHEYVEWKQTAHAMEAYRQAVQIHPGDYRAWYGLGQTYELLELYLYALHYFQKAAQLRPHDARMWTAVGNCLGQLQCTDQAMRAYERALQQEDKEGVATQKLALLYQKRGWREKAARCYLQHLQNRFQVTTNNTSSAVAAAASSNTDDSMADLASWLPSLAVVEAPEAEALQYLAQYYRDHGEYDTAALIASRLLEYPGPEKEEAKALLRELRTRSAATTAATPDETTSFSFTFSP